jgi:hypothetical protein
LADEFITRVIKFNVKDPMALALDALKRNVRDVPAQMLQNLICSFLDTLRESPNASNYPKLLQCTFELVKLLLRSSQPQLVAEVALKVWKEFPIDSSSHRKVSLVKIGSVLTPKEAVDLIQGFVAYVCDAVQKRQASNDSNEAFIKVTTMKMLIQGLAEADCLALSTRLRLLESICGTCSHRRPGGDSQLYFPPDARESEL